VCARACVYVNILGRCSQIFNVCLHTCKRHTFLKTGPIQETYKRDINCVLIIR